MGKPLENHGKTMLVGGDGGGSHQMPGSKFMGIIEQSPIRMS